MLKISGYSRDHSTEADSSGFKRQQCEEDTHERGDKMPIRIGVAGATDGRAVC